MDFWDSGIYVVIIIIAFSLVMLSIMLMSKTIRQKGKRIYKRKDVYQETAGAEEEEKPQLPLDSVPHPHKTLASKQKDFCESECI